MSQQQGKRRRIEDAASNADSSSEGDDECLDQFDLLLQQMDGINEYHNIANTVRRTMLEIAQIKERNSERRHRELMGVLKIGFANESLAESRTVVEENVDSTGESAYISTGLQEASEVKSINAAVTSLQQQFVDIDEVEPTSVEIKTISKASKSVPAIQKRKDDYVEMRQRLIAVQKQKMADRERKKQEQERKRIK